MIRKVLISIGLLLTALIGLHLAKAQLSLDFIDAENPPTLSFHLPMIRALERQAYDIRVRISATSSPDTQIVIIDVDERSMQTEGQWPWPRVLFAKLLDRLFDDYQIDTLGFDVTFPEPETRYTDQRISDLVKTNSNSSAVLEALRAESGDQVFARALANRSTVLGAVFQTLGNSQNENIADDSGELPEPAFSYSTVDYATILHETDAPNAHRYTGNIEILANSAAATGFFSISELVGDPDGIIRRVELLNRYKDTLYPSLALQVVQTFLGIPVEPIVLDDPDDNFHGLEWIETILGRVPLDSQAAVFVPYSKPGVSYTYIPATDILSGEYSGDLTGAIAIIGTSAAGLVDLRNTPVAPALPGVEVHANVISALLEKEFRVEPSWAIAFDLIVAVFIGVLFSFVLPRSSAFWSTTLYLSGVGLAIWGNWYFWSEKFYIFTIAPGLFLMTSLYILNMVVGFFSESQARRVTQKMFGLYVPPEVVSEMSANTDIFSLASKKAELTVLFCDIRDFTTISESMEPEELSEWLNDFLTPMTQIIHKHGGAIDKYMGDAIMAFWGAPLPDENHASNGVKAAIEMIQYLDTLNADAEKKGRPSINIGVGLNTGWMSVGNMGSEFRMAYTVVGDAVNLGSRLEGLTKQYKVSIVVSEFTREKALGFDYQRLDRVKVKGKNDAVTIYSCDPQQVFKEPD